MDDFIECLNSAIKAGDNEKIGKYIEPLLYSSSDDTQRLPKFDILMSMVKNPILFAFDILTQTDDILIVERLLQALDYKVNRSLNACLLVIMNMDVLSFIVNHPYAKFNVGYKTFEPVRLAVLNMDIERLAIFMSSKKVDIHASGQTTMNKSAVEIAVMFHYDQILLMFIEHGLKCTHKNYSMVVNNYVTALETKTKKDKMKIVCDVVDDMLSDVGIQQSSLNELFRHSNNTLLQFADSLYLVSSLQKIKSNLR